MATPVDSSVSVFSNAGPVLADTSQITQDGGSVVARQRIIQSDSADPDGHMAVLNRSPSGSEYGGVVRAASLDNLLATQLQMAQEFRDYNTLSLAFQRQIAQELRDTRTGSGKLDSGGAARVTGETLLKTFTASQQWAPASLATDVFAIFGNSTTAVKVRQIRLQLLSTATTVDPVNVLLIARISANVGGTSATAAYTPHDLSNDGTPNSVPVYYTANPTSVGVGAGVGGYLRYQYVPVITLGTLSAPETADPTIIFDLTAPGIKPTILRGTGQGLAVNFNGVTVTATATVVVSITWTEESFSSNLSPPY